MHRPLRQAVLVLLLIVLPAAGTSWRLTDEPVDRLSSFSGNIAALWGYHQPIVARTGDRVYAALIQGYGEGFAQEWTLYERRDGMWRDVWTTPREGQLNQPPSIVADRDGTVHVFAWPDGALRYYRFAPSAEEPALDFASSPYDDLWPYAGASINADGDLLVVASAWEQNLFSFKGGNGIWRRGRVFRHPPAPWPPAAADRQAYPFVLLDGSAAHVFTTQDIPDQAKIDAGVDFTYSFRNLRYYYTPDIEGTPFTSVVIADVEESLGFVHNDDLAITPDGRVHLIYRVMGTEGDWADLRTMHAFGPPGGAFTHVQLGDNNEFGLGRWWVAPDGTLHATLPHRGPEVKVAAIGPDGRLAETPAPIGIAPDGWNSWGRLFTVPKRASAGGAPYLEGIYFKQLDEGVEARYFRADPLPSTAVTLQVPERFALRLEPPFPNPFNAATVIRFTTDVDAPVVLDIVNLAGQQVARLADAPLPAGTHRVVWDGTGQGGAAVATGVYLVRLRVGSVSDVRRVALIQ